MSDNDAERLQQRTENAEIGSSRYNEVAGAVGLINTVGERLGLITFEPPVAQIIQESPMTVAPVVELTSRENPTDPTLEQARAAVESARMAA